MDGQRQPSNHQATWQSAQARHATRSKVTQDRSCPGSARAGHLAQSYERVADSLKSTGARTPATSRLTFVAGNNSDKVDSRVDTELHKDVAKMPANGMR